VLCVSRPVPGSETTPSAPPEAVVEEPTAGPPVRIPVRSSGRAGDPSLDPASRRARSRAAVGGAFLAAPSSAAYAHPDGRKCARARSHRRCETRSGKRSPRPCRSRRRASKTCVEFLPVTKRLQVFLLYVRTVVSVFARRYSSAQFEGSGSLNTDVLAPASKNEVEVLTSCLPLAQGPHGQAASLNRLSL
jgi:hypothetical protein